MFAANWKMNGSLSMISRFFDDLDLKSDEDVVVFPPAIYLSDCVKYKAGRLEFGVQNVWSEDSGAFTGEISAKMSKEQGANWVLIGHSERRNFQNEAEDLIREKLACSLKSDMNVILCVGESLEQRKKGNAEKIVADQIRRVLLDTSRAHGREIVIAYEPLWAIGTGRTAGALEAQKMHSFIRQLVAEALGWDINYLRVIYGGSVNDQNSQELLAQKDIDGFLVGGASLEPGTFSNIVNSLAL